jgi:tight adherence protein C
VIVLVVIGLLLAGAAVAVVGRALMLPRQRMVANVTGIEQYGFATPAAPDDVQSRAALSALAKFVGESLGGRLGGLFREAELRQTLVSAGMYSISARMLFGYQVIGAVGLGAIWLWLSIAGSMGAATIAIGTIVAIVFGWLGPVVYVRRRARERLGAIDYATPELIDLLVVSVEAGMGFAGALRVSAERMGGPLGAELRLANHEQQMGLPVTDALENMLARCPTDTMRAFVRAVVEGQRLGVSIGQIMRSLAVEMRKRRRQLAEERAHKILFPLVFMIFPAMFIVLLGPAMFQIIDQLGNK